MKKIYAISPSAVELKTIFISADIEVLKKKKLKIEVELATDDKNKETIANQIRMLSEKLDEIDGRQQVKKNQLAKIDDTLLQSEIGMFDSMSSIS